MSTPGHTSIGLFCFMFPAPEDTVLGLFWKSPCDPPARSSLCYWWLRRWAWRMPERKARSRRKLQKMQVRYRPHPATYRPMILQCDTCSARWKPHEGIQVRVGLAGLLARGRARACAHAVRARGLLSTRWVERPIRVRVRRVVTTELRCPLTAPVPLARRRGCGEADGRERGQAQTAHGQGLAECVVP